MTAAKDATLVVVDVETTGLGHKADPPREDGVVQIGWAWRNSNGVIVTEEMTCDPGLKFFDDHRADEALVINHLSFDEIIDAPTAEAACLRLEQALAQIPNPVLSSYNVEFDRVFLEQLGLQCNWTRCIMKEAIKRWCPPETPHYSLWKAMIMANLQYNGEAHRASVDAEAALQLAEYLGIVS